MCEINVILIDRFGKAAVWHTSPSLKDPGLSEKWNQNFLTQLLPDLLIDFRRDQIWTVVGPKVLLLDVSQFFFRNFLIN